MRVLPFAPMFRKAILGIALLFLACGKLKELPTGSGGPGDPIDPTATLTRVQNEIFTPTCAVLGCHDRLGRQEGLELSSGLAYGQIVGKASVQMPQLQRVSPTDPANSYLFRKITGAGITGDRMPQAGPVLDDAKIKLIRDWIRRGAPND